MGLTAIFSAFLNSQPRLKQSPLSSMSLMRKIPALSDLCRDAPPQTAPPPGCAAVAGWRGFAVSRMLPVGMGSGAILDGPMVAMTKVRVIRLVVSGCKADAVGLTQG